MKNYLNLCLSLPNIGLVSFYLVFIVLIPLIIVSMNEYSFLAYYSPILVAIANVLTLSGSPYLFQNLYSLNPQNIMQYSSTLFINFVALFGILWQIIIYSKHELSLNLDPKFSIIYGIVLFIITFVLATSGIKTALEQVDKWSGRNQQATKKGTIKNNWHRLFFGLIFIVVIIGLEVLLLGLVNGMNPALNINGSKNTNSKNTNSKNNNSKNNASNNASN